jgi:hypothetical protein
MKAAELHRLIVEAFVSAPKPSLEEIAPHRCSECDELASDLVAFGPFNMPEAVFRRHIWHLPLLSAEAKRYYLPAWLIRSLEIDGPWWPDECSTVVRGLGDDHRWKPNPPYTREQREAILLWLEHVAQVGDDIDLENVEKARALVESEL